MYLYQTLIGLSLSSIVGLTPIHSTPEASTTPTVTTLETKEAIVAYIKEVFEEDGDTAVAIAKAESGLNVNAHNYSDKTKDDSLSIFQINVYGDLAKSRPSRDVLKTAKGNIDYAHELFEKRGNFKDWSVFKDGSYRAFL